MGRSLAAAAAGGARPPVRRPAGRRADDEQPGERRPHALVVDVRRGRLEDLVVRLDDGGEHVVERAGGFETALEQLNGEGAGDLAGLVPAHPVGDDEHRRSTSTLSSFCWRMRPDRSDDNAPTGSASHCASSTGVADLGAVAGMEQPRARRGGCRCGTTRSSSRGPRPSAARRGRRCGRGAGTRTCRRRSSRCIRDRDRS